MKITRPILFLAVLSVLGAGCGGYTPPPTPPGLNLSILGDAAATKAMVKLPVYPGAHLRQALVFLDGKTKSAEIDYATPAPLRKVAAWYRRHLPGLHITDSGNPQFISFWYKPLRKNESPAITLVADELRGVVTTISLNAQRPSTRAELALYHRIPAGYLPVYPDSRCTDRVLSETVSSDLPAFGPAGSSAIDAHTTKLPIQPIR